MSNPEQSKEQPKEQPKRAAHLLARNFTLQAESVRLMSFAIVPVGVSQQTLKDPAFWSSVAHLLKARQRIDVECEDGSWLTELRVCAVGPNWARVQVLRHHAFVSAEALMQKAKDFKVEWGGPSHKNRVVRLSDKQVLQHGFDTPELAAEWLAANHESMTAT